MAVTAKRNMQESRALVEERKRRDTSLWKISNRMRELDPVHAPRTRSNLRHKEEQGKMEQIETLYSNALNSLAAPLTPAQVVAQWRAEGVIGAWADRQDIGDSSQYARRLREQAQCREHDAA